MSSNTTHDGGLVFDGRPTYGTARALGYDDPGMGYPELTEDLLFQKRYEIESIGRPTLTIYADGDVKREPKMTPLPPQQVGRRQLVGGELHRGRLTLLLGPQTPPPPDLDHIEELTGVRVSLEDGTLVWGAARCRVIVEPGKVIFEQQ